ncbi:MAG: RIP metalloprotease RseP [Parvibaculaceae bacterium]|nr:RIP metalloprotease RseP [Parvibaculaceae bacterium]
MGFLTEIGGFGGSLTSYLVPFLFVLTLVVFFHELGHFLIARACGVAVETFSIGFGKEIFGWNDSKGTRWRVSWIPLGGYVKFVGDEGAASNPDWDRISSIPEEERKGLFHFKKVWQRAAVVAAGPVANFILSIVIFAILFTFVGRMESAAIVDKVQPGSAAESAGFMPGDKVVSIDGAKIADFEDMQRIVSASGGVALSVTVDRGGVATTLTATPREQEVTDRFGDKHKMGLLGIVRDTSGEGVKLVKTNPLTSVWLGARETWFIVDRTFVYLGGVITGREDSSQLGGPLRIAQVSGQVATLGFAALINMAAILSVSIGLLNLFPVPMLDGGHLLYYAVEGIRGRPLGQRTQEFGFRIGLALVMMLMVFATWNDLVHLQVFQFISGLFS